MRSPLHVCICTCVPVTNAEGLSSWIWVTGPMRTDQGLTGRKRPNDARALSPSVAISAIFLYGNSIFLLSRVNRGFLFNTEPQSSFFPKPRRIFEAKGERPCTLGISKNFSVSDRHPKHPSIGVRGTRECGAVSAPARRTPCIRSASGVRPARRSGNGRSR